MERPTAVITGATRGLGRALTEAFARRGYRVYGTARTREALEALAGDAAREGWDVVTVEGDVATVDDNARLARRIAADGARVSVIVHNAGILGPRVPLAEYPPDVFAQVMAVNVFGPFDLTRQLLPLLAPRATIEFVSSGAGTGPRERWGAYNVAKIAVEGLGGIFAKELADRDVRVYLVDPGPMRTSMRARAYPEEDPGTLALPEARAGVFVWLADSPDAPPSGTRVDARTVEVR